MRIEVTIDITSRKDIPTWDDLSDYLNVMDFPDVPVVLGPDYAESYLEVMEL